MIIPVVGPTYNLKAQVFDCQRCVNLFPDISESGSSKQPTRLVGSPGLELFATAGTGPHRGAITTAGGRNFWVSANKLYEVSASGTVTERGTLNTSISRVSLAENGEYLAFVDGVNGYTLKLSDNDFQQITDVDFPNGATVIAYQDTYFIVNDPDTGDFYISAQNNPTSWSATDKTTVESSPDNLVSLLSDHGELILGGSRSMEIYYNSGNANFPFERITQAVMQVGIAAAHTLKSFDNNVLWVSEDEKGGRFIYKMSGAYRPQRVSNQAVERALAGAENISEAYAWVYKQEGHEFYVLNVPGLPTSWVLDAATNLWHERMYFNPQLSQEELHRGSCHTFFNGMNLVGDRESGKIYKMRLDHYSDDGDELHALRITPHISNEGMRLFYADLHLDMENGVGLVTGQGSDPVVMMRYSDDGGRKWSNERSASFGKIGSYNTRARWTRLGSSRDRVFEFRITDPVQRCIIGCYSNVSLGAN